MLTNVDYGSMKEGVCQCGHRDEEVMLER